MVTRKFLAFLYLINATILITHQVDAAYWHEWTLFGIPGGIQMFLLLNLPIVFLILYGQQALISGQNSGIVFSWLLSASGLGAFCVHIIFLSQGDESFRLPVSIGILITALAISVLQGFWTLKLQRESKI